MMEFDPKTYPSRTFIRFLAHQQLLADASGQPIQVAMQRLDRPPYLQTLTPGSDVATSKTSSQDMSMGLGLRMTLSANPTGKDQGQGDRPTGQISARQGKNKSPIDENLFEEVVKTAFNSDRNLEIYQSCGTVTGAEAVELGVIREIVSTYRQIQQNRTSPTVQNLNKLLD